MVSSFHTGEQGGEQGFCVVPHFKNFKYFLAPGGPETPSLRNQKHFSKLKFVPQIQFLFPGLFPKIPTDFTKLAHRNGWKLAGSSSHFQEQKFLDEVQQLHVVAFSYILDDYFL